MPSNQPNPAADSPSFCIHVAAAFQDAKDEQGVEVKSPVSESPDHVSNRRATIGSHGWLRYMTIFRPSVRSGFGPG
jgi:hypothetical protein